MSDLNNISPSQHLKKIDIVLPCFSPLDGWETKILTAYKKLSKLLPDWELYITLVNDGSLTGLTDDHINLLKSEIPNFFYTSYQENMGKGFALRKGIQSTQLDYCLYTDVDFPYTEQSVLDVIENLEAGDSDIVIGVKDANYYENLPASRRVLSKVLKWLSKKILRLQINDTQCGLKAFNQKGKEIFLKTEINRYLFDLEFVYLASAAKDISLVPVEIELKKDVEFTNMRLSSIAMETLNFLKVVLKFKL